MMKVFYKEVDYSWFFIIICIKVPYLKWSVGVKSDLSRVMLYMISEYLCWMAQKGL